MTGTLKSQTNAYYAPRRKVKIPDTISDAKVWWGVIIVDNASAGGRGEGAGLRHGALLHLNQLLKLGQLDHLVRKQTIKGQKI